MGTDVPLKAMRRWGGMEKYRALHEETMMKDKFRFVLPVAGVILAGAVLAVLFLRPHPAPEVRTGLPGDQAYLGMSCGEVKACMGTPDAVYEEAGINTCTYVYQNVAVYGGQGTLSYQFSGREEASDTVLTRVTLGLDFAEEATCTVAYRQLQEDLEAVYSQDAGYQCYPRDVSWEDPARRQEYILTGDGRCVSLRAASCRITARAWRPE